VKWLNTVEFETQSGTFDTEEQEILHRLHELISQTDLDAKGDNLSAVVLDLAASFLLEPRVYSCTFTFIQVSH
jgi:hypothetical protein